ncbi:nitroreductase/quinone reductase family protein [Spirillospora sp. NPDC047279]|uniref:nitroreductase/quinone reductase family protein n=1 Tax=Spirillospora sp. NPDC047279 TaxID=3155478 RepID=UPI0033EBDAA3
MSGTTAPPTVPRWVNVLVRGLLRSPAHRLMSRSTMVLTVTGRRTGKEYTFPVSYYRTGGAITCYTDGGWWRNLVGGAPVSLLIAGRRLAGHAEVVALDHDDAVLGLHEFLRHLPRDARYHGVRRVDGGFDAGDLDRAARTSRLVRITPR